MGACSSKKSEVELEVERRNAELEKQSRIDFEQQQKKIKLLLLGGSLHCALHCGACVRRRRRITPVAGASLSYVQGRASRASPPSSSK
jgi:hypothetical protein